MRCFRKQVNKLSITSVFVSLKSTSLLIEKQHLDSLYANKTNLQTFSKNYRKVPVPDDPEELLISHSSFVCKTACKIEAWMWDNIESDLKQMILVVLDYSVMLAVDGGYF
jgi:hypothetical protein